MHCVILCVIQGGCSMLIGYARVSSADQREDRQVDALLSAGVDQEHIFIDKVSGKDFNRSEYQAMLKTLRSGDVLVVKSIKRFGRNYDEIKKEFQRIGDMGVFINIIDMPLLNTDKNIDQGLTSKFITDLVLSILSYVAEQERLDIKKRQREGIESAKKRGKHLGRPKLNQDKLVQVEALIQAGVKVNEACETIGISRRVYYKYQSLKDRL
jgi:DNA invertase Pin-like site-specific DNA recombinase